MLEIGRWTRTLVASACLWATGLGAAGAAPDERTRAGDIRVLTLNQYLGADLTPLLAADAAGFNQALLDTLAQVAANDFPARARRQAAIVDREQPDLIGLQEVWAYACQPLTPGACDEPTIRGAFVDHLPVTLAALAARGLDYEVAGFIENFDTGAINVPNVPVPGLPFTLNGKTGVLLAKDRDVILRRKGVATEEVTFPGCRTVDDGCHFEVILQVPFAGIALAVERGFLAVDATLRGRTYRFVNTHLEVELPDPGNPLSKGIQAAQAQELIARLGALPLPAQAELILVGDINSSPVSTAPANIVTPYRQFRRAGFYDAWSARGGRGFTCCQDADLRNGRSKLSERIDVVLVRTRPVTVRRIEVVGDSLGERTQGPPKLWPSDHAGVAARLRF